MLISRIALFLIFLSTYAYTQEDQWVVSGGVGVADSINTRTLTLSIQEDLWGALKQRGTVGGWLDDSGNGKSGSALISGQLGFEVNRNGMVIGLFSGPTFISSPDVMLGGYLQFMTNFHLGIQDGNSNYIGAFYRHISNASLSTPNIGRDIIGLEIRF